MIPGASSPRTSTLIGVAICIAANTLVCLSLNLQRLSHLRRDRSRHSPAKPHERTPLIVATKASQERSPSESGATADRPQILLRLTSTNDSDQHGSSTEPSAPASPALGRRSSSRSSSRRDKRPITDKGFLKSKLWLAGLACLVLGELGNFLAYGFAAPSVVAPLGMVALVANVFLAPIVVREPFRSKDLVGVVIALVGGATVVYASRSSDQKPTPEEFLSAISHPLFIAYTVVSTVSMAILAYLSRTKLGDRYVLIDLSLCALAGAFTVLSTKAISSFLNLLFLNMFSYWITYPVLAVLIATALLQVNYVNKSLQRFESRIVVPTQYMTFALSTIIGSAILYRDFEGVELPSLLNFLFGCVISASGVYLLASGPPQEDPPPRSGSRSRSDALLPLSAPSDDSVSSGAQSSGPRDRLVHGGSHNLSGHDMAPPSLPGPDPTESATLRAPGGITLGRARKLSVTLGGGYLLAGSPGSIGIAVVEAGRRGPHVLLDNAELETEEV